MKTWLGKIRLWEVALFLFLGFGCYLFWVTAQSEKQVATQTVAVLDHADKTLTGVDTTLGLVNSTVTQIGGSFGSAASSLATASSGLNLVVSKLLAPCQPVKGHIYTVDEDKPCGTLADVARTLHTIRGFAGTLETAGRHLDKSLGTYDQQEADLSEHTNEVLTNLGSTVDYAHQLMVAHEKLLANLERLAGNSADTMQNVTGITGDIRVQTKKMNAPKTKTQKVLEWAPVGVRVGVTVACAVFGPC